MVGTIVGGALGFSYSYGNAMFLIFESGIIFLLLSIISCDKTKDGKRNISLREKIFEAISTGIRLAIPVGIGLFITYIGLQNTTFVESGVGISFGAKTGFSSLICSIMFLLSIFLLPLFAFIPKEAVAGALIYVGFLMMKNIKNIDFNNIKYGIPSFLIIIMMILTYSITDAVGIGIMTFVIIDLIIYIIDYFKYKLKNTKKKPTFEITLTTIIMFIMFAIYFFVPMI